MERVLFAPRALPPLPPDVAEDPGPFSEWVQRREAERAAAHVSRPAASSLRLVMPMAGEAPPSLVPSLQSLNRQTVTSWTLTVVLERAWHNSFTAALSVSGLLRSATRVQVEPRQDGEGLQSLLTHGLALNEGNDVAVIFPGDVWAPDTVAQLASGLVPDGVVYADEDVVGPDGAHEAPVLKPAHSPELLLGCSSVGRPLALGREVLHAVLRTEGTVSGDIEHDLALRATEVARHVEHNAEVLCHRLVPAGPSDDAGPVMAALRRRKESGAVEPGPARGTFSIRRAADVDGTASLIIPFRDEPALLRACVDSVESTRQGQRCELVLVDNGSVQPETATLLERLEQRAHIRIVRDERPFNWAELSNAGARLAGGDVLVFMNNDIEARRPGWLGALCAQAQRADVGAVGARLLYPDHRLQHCGVVLGLGGAAGHILVGLDEHKPGYLSMAVLSRECAAVTGACLATRRSVYDALGGFDESLGVDLNDIDYCLRCQRQGWRVLYEPAAELVHYESPSRGTAGDVKDIVRFIDRWRDTILAGDPYLNPHLTRIDSSCRLRRPEEKEWWQQWHASLSRT